MATYDRHEQLIINPTLAYSTYVGGTGGDQSNGIAVDGQSNAYIAGYTRETDYPTTSGSFQTSFGTTVANAFVAKLNAAGSGLVYATYLSSNDPNDVQRGQQAKAIWVDKTCKIDCNAFVVGFTSSAGFPVTPGAYQPRQAGPSVSNAFLTELNAEGSGLVYSTYLGGTSGESANAIAVEGGNAYIAGITSSKDFPTTAGSINQKNLAKSTGTGFVSKLHPGGRGHAVLLYSTFLGGTASDNATGIGVDAAGNAFVTGSAYSSDFPTTPGSLEPTWKTTYQSAFVSRISADGSSLLYSTYLGGSGNDGAMAIAIDPDGDAYVAGSATSGDFPTTPGAFQTRNAGGRDAFISKLNVTGSRLIFSTFLGGHGDPNPSTDLTPGDDSGHALSVDASGRAYVSGTTTSSDFPVVEAVQSKYAGNGDAFVAQLSEDGAQLSYSSFLGGLSTDVSTGIALNAAGDAFVTGYTGSPDFPTTAGAYQTRGHPIPNNPYYPANNSFLSRISTTASTQTPSPSPTSTPAPTASSTPTPAPSPSANPTPTPSAGSGGYDSPWVDVHPNPTPPLPPGQRTSAMMAYRPDGAGTPSSGKLVLFGGCCSSVPTSRSTTINGMGPVGVDTSPPLGDTWTWDGNMWRQESPTVSPAPRTDAVLALDPRSGKLVLFGGSAGGY
ncbi:MAG: SBBP repeat-containing protein, partial [Actinobacteria bacterium]|nr:SBBP repeat-containing protein [Actinomycetota bacterium]